MMKKVIAILLAAAMVLAMTACNKKAPAEESTDTKATEAETTKAEETEAETTEETTEEATEETTEEAPVDGPVVGGDEEGQIVGGWLLNDRFAATEMSEEEIDRFAKAMECFDGAGYDPIAILGQQVVAGMNYAYLCQGQMVVPGAAPSLYVVKVYADLEGNVSITDAEKVEVDDLLELFEADDDEDDADDDVDGGMLVGGYTVNENLGGVILPGDSLQAFAEATQDLAGASYLPVALVGSQVVAGSNYLIIAKQTKVTNPPVSSICVMKVYSPIDGSAPTITDVKAWDYWD